MKDILYGVNSGYLDVRGGVVEVWADKETLGEFHFLLPVVKYKLNSL